MIKLLIKSFVISILSMSVACTVQKEKTQTPSIKTGQGSIVTISDPSIRVSPHATYTWLQEAIKYHHNPRLKNSGIQSMIQNAIGRSMNEKGYRFVNTTTRSELLIGYTIALQSSLSDKEILNQYGIQPGLATRNVSADDYEKGVLVIHVLQPGTRKTIWRGAIQAYVYLNQDQDTREIRINKAVNQLMAGFP